jgi:hypothetical protein
MAVEVLGMTLAYLEENRRYISAPTELGNLDLADGQSAAIVRSERGENSHGVYICA